MLLFKTSAATLDSVIHNRKHALKHEPKNWGKNELLLISKNRIDCKQGEKQIQFIMNLNSIKKYNNTEIKKFWPNAKNNWEYLVDCDTVVKLEKPFDLTDVIGVNAKIYKSSLKPKKILGDDEKKILAYLKNMKAI